MSHLSEDNITTRAFIEDFIKTEAEVTRQRIQDDKRRQEGLPSSELMQEAIAEVLLRHDVFSADERGPTGNYVRQWHEEDQAIYDDYSDGLDGMQKTEKIRKARINRLTADITNLLLGSEQTKDKS